MIYDIIGIFGVTLVLFSYLLLQLGKISSEDLRYILMNMFGSGGILVSLTQNFNVASVLIESSWVTISLIGLIRYYKKRRA